MPSCQLSWQRKACIAGTLRAEFLFVFFLIEQVKSRLFLERVKFLKPPQPKLLIQSILFFLIELVFRVRAAVIVKPMVKTTAAVPSAWLLGLGSKLYPSSKQRACSTKILLESCSLSQVNVIGSYASLSIRKISNQSRSLPPLLQTLRSICDFYII